MLKLAGKLGIIVCLSLGLVACGANKASEEDVTNDTAYEDTDTTPYVKGDANSDGKVDEADHDITKQYILGDKTVKIRLKAADANEDGKINSMDLMKIKEMYTKE